MIIFAAGLGGVPWDAGGRAIETPVGLVDLAPTILERAGVKPPPRLDGLSLAPLLGGEAEEASRSLFIEAVQPFEAYGWSPLFAVVEGNRKVVVGKRLAAFDLKADPGETAPIDPAPDWASRLAGYGRPLLGSLDPPEALQSRIRREARGLALPWADRRARRLVVVPTLPAATTTNKQLGH